jgi:hypothetical protein
MALPVEPDETEDDRKKKPGEPGQDPLFYEGTTPVLGEAVSLAEPKGELGFPQASPAPSPMAAPLGPMPTPPQFPDFPNFDFNWEFTPPEFNFNPSAPPRPPDVQLPQGPEVPWWQKALATGETAADKAVAAKKAYDASQAMGAPPTWTGGSPSLFSLTGAAPEEWFAGSEGMFNLSGEGLPATDTAYNLGEGASKVYTGLPGDVAPPAAPFTTLGSSVAPALAALGAGVGAYGAATAEPGSAQQVSSGLGAVSGGVSLASQLGLLGAGMGAAPYATAALALPFITGKLYEAYGPPSEDKIQTPPGWAYVPGTGNSRGVGGYVVDPATGRVVQYAGNGRYVPFGIMSPDQFQKYGIEPTGSLAQRPDYAGVAPAIRAEDIAQAGQPGPGGAPQFPTEAHQRSYLEEWRQPYIDQLKIQYPMADEPELWRLYTLSPWYQQELLMQQGWNPNAPLGDRGR